MIIGHIKKAQGIKGELFLFIHSGDVESALEWTDQLEKWHLLSPGGEAKDFELESKKVHKEGLVIKLLGVNDRNRAEELKGWSLEVPESLLKTESQTDFYLREILDFTVFNGEQEVGVIKAFSDNSAQDLIVLETKEGEFEIPLVDQFIDEILYNEKQVKMNFPAELLMKDFGQ